MSVPGSSSGASGKDSIAEVDIEDDQWEYYDDSTTLSDFWQVTSLVWVDIKINGNNFV